MNRTISFYVVGEPKAQPRPKAFSRKVGDKYITRVYTPGTAESWKTAIAVAAKNAGLTKFDGAVHLELYFNFKRPKSHFNSNGRVKVSAPAFHTQRPDFDNASKSAADALTAIGAWNDDAQIVRATICKDWAIGDSPGGCHITISEL